MISHQTVCTDVSESTRGHDNSLCSSMHVHPLRHSGSQKRPFKADRPDVPRVGFTCKSVVNSLSAFSVHRGRAQGCHADA